jgi:hypothetical protein
MWVQVKLLFVAGGVSWLRGFLFGRARSNALEFGPGSLRHFIPARIVRWWCHSAESTFMWWLAQSLTMHSSGLRMSLLAQAGLVGRSRLMQR